MSPRYITFKEPRKNSGSPEFDSDAHVDAGREMQLDQSFAEWTNSRIEQQSAIREALTQVPEQNVFESAENGDQT